MADIIMTLGVFVFFTVFFLLALTLVLFVVSFFIRPKQYPLYYPKVSVIIPAYNEEKNIVSCLDTLFACGYPAKKLEVLVIDDGSSDTTRTLVKKYKNVRLLRQRHKGKVAALNLGFENSSGEVIVTIDADTLVEKEFLREMVRPFSDPLVGATSGAVRVKNNDTLLGTFAHMEYLVNNLARYNFSKVFNTGIWFFGSLAAYRWSALKQVNGFKYDTQAEDWDVVLEIRRAGYGVLNVNSAIGYTVTPERFSDLFRQRVRWWMGGSQAIIKNKSLLAEKNPSLWYLFIHHYWWAFYALVSLPLIIYQVHYWMPVVLADIPLYLFRWFTLIGPFYVLSKIPEWGINIYNIFGVLAGIISLLFTVSAVIMQKEKVFLRHVLAVFFYFPYTILLNLAVAVSVIKHIFSFRKPSYFIK